MTIWKVKLTEDSKGDFKKLDGKEKIAVAKKLINLERDPAIGNPLGNKMGMDLTGYFNSMRREKDCGLCIRSKAKSSK